MTILQGQSVKRHTNKKNFKIGQNQPNALFIFITFRNHRQKMLMLFQIYKCRRFRKSNQKRAPELGIPAEWQVGETSLKQEKLQKRSKSTKCYIHFHNFPESSAKYFNFVSHLHLDLLTSTKVLCNVLVQLHFIQREQFSKTNVTSHAFQHI